MWLNGTTQCSGGNLPPSTLQIQPVWLNGSTYRHVIPSERKRVEESSQAASFTLCWFFVQRGGFLHSADAAVGMTSVFAVVVTSSNEQRVALRPMAADCRRYTRYVQQNTQCSGDDSSPWHVANITRVVEWNHAKPSPSGKGDRRRRWMRRGTAFRIVGTAGAEGKHIEKAALALPLGELSPQVA